MNKIHIGYPKTATTFLQREVFKELKNHKFIGHSEFRKLGLINLIWKADRSIDYDNLKELFRSNNNNFISFEDLSGPLFQGSIMIDEIPNRLFKIFGKELKVLITIRRQEDLLRSIYIQYIHQGGTNSLYNFLKKDSLGMNRIDLNAFNFLETYNRYKSVFGNSNIVILPYEKFKINPTEFIGDLNDFFENENIILKKNKVVYRSMDGLQLRLLKNLNRFIQTPISEKYIIPPHIINQSKIRFWWQDSDFLRIGNFFNEEDLQLLKTVSRRYYDSNRQLDEQLSLNLDLYKYY
ncbi:hypothetical protein GCM10023115_25570 [Pontixanthobacter gangjinensis]